MPFVKELDPETTAIKRTPEYEAVNLSLCVESVQLNTGPENDFQTVQLSVSPKGGATTKLTFTREETAVLLITLDIFEMEKSLVAKENLYLEFFRPTALGGNQLVGRPVSFSESRFHGFRTPKMQLVFGEEYFFALMYATAFQTEEIFCVKLECVDPATKCDA
jgi:hypothetical protein